MNKTKTICLHCKQLLERSCYNGGDSICIECKRKDKEAAKLKWCNDCKRYKKKYTEIGVTSKRCYDCKQKHWDQIKDGVKLTKIFERNCANPNCKNVFVVDKPRATVIYCQEYRTKREELKRQKAEAFKNMKITRTCYNCGELIEVNDLHTPTTIKCDKCIADPERKNNKIYKRKCKICGDEILTDIKLSTYIKCDKCKSLKLERKTIYRDGKYFRNCCKCHEEFEIVKTSKKMICDICKNKNKIQRPQFGKKKHFGYYGIASDGHRWDSLNEQDYEEWLIANNIRHKSHARIGNSLKHSDLYVFCIDTHLEIDGLDREKDYEWGGKLELYKSLNLNMKIVKPVPVHFKDNKDGCFKYLDKQFSFLKRNT
jgi:hypothetical protein